MQRGQAVSKPIIFTEEDGEEMSFEVSLSSDDFSFLIHNLDTQETVITSPQHLRLAQLRKQNSQFLRRPLALFLPNNVNTRHHQQAIIRGAFQASQVIQAFQSNCRNSPSQQ